MPQRKRIPVNIHFSPEEFERINEALAILNEGIGPYIKHLEAERWSELLQMSDESQATSEDLRAVTRFDVEDSPRIVDGATTPFTAEEKMRSLSQNIRTILDAVEDTRLIVEYNALQTALDFYDHVRAAAETNPDAARIYEDLTRLLDEAGLSPDALSVEWEGLDKSK